MMIGQKRQCNNNRSLNNSSPDIFLSLSLFFLFGCVEEEEEEGKRN
jgi:hypothetical protein